MNFSINHRSLSDFITAFEEGTLSREEWTHHAHLTMALWYVLHYPGGEAERRIREGIKHYNAAVGVVSTPTSGYHETLTCFYTLVVKRFAETADHTALSIETLVEMMLASEIADRAYPLRFYSKELLFSTEARAAWTEPDKCRLN
jgi:hypothetical protein